MTIEIDFDQLREQLVDLVFAAAGHVAGFVEDRVDDVEFAADRLASYLDQ